MATEFKARSFQGGGPSGSVSFTAISETGKFVITNGGVAAARGIWVWNEALQQYVGSALPTALVTAAYGSFSGDDFFVVTSTLGCVLYAVNPTTGALTQLAVDGTATATGWGYPIYFPENNRILVFSITAGATVVRQLEYDGSATLIVITSINLGSAGSTRCAARGPTIVPGLPTAWRIVELSSDVTQVQQIQFAAGAANPPVLQRTLNIGTPDLNGRINSIRPSFSRRTALLTSYNSGTVSPYIRAFRMNPTTNALQEVTPGGGTSINTFPRADLGPVSPAGGSFISREDHFITRAANSGAGAATDLRVYQADADFISVMGSSEIVPDPSTAPQSILREQYMDILSDNGKVSVHIAPRAPYVMVIEESLPSATFLAAGLLGSANVEAEVSIRADFEPMGLMGSAAIQADITMEVARIAAHGILGSASLVAGTDDGGADRKFVYLHENYVLLDSGPLTYTVEFAGYSALLDAMGLMGDANIRSVQGEYIEIHTQGILGQADIAAHYDTTQAQIAARGIMGRAAMQGDVRPSAIIQAQGLMGRAIVVMRNPNPVTFDATGLMGYADIIVLPPQEGTIEASGVLGDVTMWMANDENGIIESVGILGQADIVLDLHPATIDAMGILGDASILTERTKEWARWWSIGILGRADIETLELIPIDAAIDAMGIIGDAAILIDGGQAGFIEAFGLIGHADIEADMNTAQFDAVGLLGDASIISQSDEFARLNATGILGVAEAYIADGWRGDFRAIGLKGRADIEMDVKTNATIDAVGIMGIAHVEARRTRRTKRFFIVKPF